MDEEQQKRNKVQSDFSLKPIAKILPLLKKLGNLSSVPGLADRDASLAPPTFVPTRSLPLEPQFRGHQELGSRLNGQLLAIYDDHLQLWQIALVVRRAPVSLHEVLPVGQLHLRVKLLEKKRLGTGFILAAIAVEKQLMIHDYYKKWTVLQDTQMLPPSPSLLCPSFADLQMLKFEAGEVQTLNEILSVPDDYDDFVAKKAQLNLENLHLLIYCNKELSGWVPFVINGVFDLFDSEMCLGYRLPWGGYEHDGAQIRQKGGVWRGWWERGGRRCDPL